MEEIFIKRARLCTRNILKIKSKGKLLDVGCSYGFYLKIFHIHGFLTQGIDISKSAIKYIKQILKLNAVVGNFENYYFPQRTFDVITMFDSIEHFSNPKEILSKANKIIKKNGLIVIQTPNIKSVIANLTGKKWFWLLPQQHLFLFSIKSLKLLLEQTGFKIVKISTWDDYHEFISNILSLFRINYWERTSLLHRILVKFKYALIPIAYLWNIFFLGGEILIYAQKE